MIGRELRPPAHLHCLGICGYAVSGLALTARAAGFQVSGADEDAYPPTTDTLAAAGIPVAARHRASNLDRYGPCDLVVVGNQLRADNVEWAAARARGLPLASEAEVYRMLTEDRRRLVVCGTHGKTTTAALAAWMLAEAGQEPGFRLGATHRNFGETARLGRDRPQGPFVFEGDEYTTTARDPRAKFLHWAPEVVTALNLEWDHPDVYLDLAAYRAPFAALVQGLPPAGRLIVNGEDPLTQALASLAACPVERFGVTAGDWRCVEPPRPGPDGGTALRVVGPGLHDPLPLALPLSGRHNVMNALAALATAVAGGAGPAAAAAAAAGYRGLGRRFEVLGTAAGVTVVDDYAHHPTEVAAAVEGARARFGPDRFLAVIYVPHTYSRTLALLQGYREAFRGADAVLLGPIEPARERHLQDTVHVEDLAAVVAGPPVVIVPDADTAIAWCAAQVPAGGVVVSCSVRGFDGCAPRLLAALAERDGG